MIYGLDTGFLIAAEMLEHAEHVAARDTFTTNPADFTVLGAFTCITLMDLVGSL